MTKTITLSESLCDRLENTAQQLGFPNVEQLLNTWLKEAEEKSHRLQVVQEIDTVRKRLYKKYGEMPDSVELIRQDRHR